MTTVEELNKWMSDNESDVFVDGDYNFTDGQWSELGKKMANHFNIELEDEDWYMDLQMTCPDLDEMLKVFVDYINENNINS